MKKFPFFPKSTAKLVLGDYCSLKRDYGLYVPLAFLSKVGNSRSYFYGALLSCVGQTEVLTEGEATFKVFESALLGVNVFSKNNAPAVGNIAARLNENEIAEILSKIKNKNQRMGLLNTIEIC